MKKYALVTGSSSGIGREISRQLLTTGTSRKKAGFSSPESMNPADRYLTDDDLTDNDLADRDLADDALADCDLADRNLAGGDLADCWEVYGLSRHASASDMDGLPPELAISYHPVVCDLRNRAELTHIIKELQREVSFDLLVNNAGVGFFGPHEEISPDKLHNMVAVNLEAPLILTSLLLRDLKKTKGTILNLSSVTARKSSNTHGCAYGATKAALTSFGNSLFEEVRKYGVRVITLQPDMTESNFYAHTDFCQGNDPASYLTAGEVAETALSLLSLREGSLITELTLRPQLHRIERKKS